jgi:hypothetical protein
LIVQGIIRQEVSIVDTVEVETVETVEADQARTAFLTPKNGKNRDSLLRVDARGFSSQL